MSKTRLNQFIRAEVTKAAMEKFLADFKATEERLSDAIIAAVKASLPPEVKALADSKDKYARDFLSFGSARVRIKNKSYYAQRGEDFYLPNSARYADEKTIPAKELKELEAAVAAVDEWRDNYNKAQAAIHAVLHSNTTVEQLIDAWPEVVDFLPPLGTGKAKLPAVRVDDLNKMLGITPKAGGAA